MDLNNADGVKDALKSLSREEQLNVIKNIYNKKFLELVAIAYSKHVKHFANDIEMCQLISVKTGGCPEDCGYCSQSNKHETEIKLNALLPIEEVEQTVIEAKKNGVKRICMGAAYKSPNSSALDKSCEYIKIVKKHGLETCLTLGSLSAEQTDKLKNAGLDYYNHNIDTSPEYYKEVVTTRTFQDRIDTINNVGQAGIKVCCGGIIGMGETKDDRISFIHALTMLPYVPDSIPINMHVKVPGTKLHDTPVIDKFELVRTIATVRILFPQTRVRLSAGRRELTDLEQSLCFMAGANSLFFGDKLLTADNNEKPADLELLHKLGL
jgi:biotin synthase